MSSMLNYVASFFSSAKPQAPSEPQKQQPFTDKEVTLTDWTGKVTVLTENKNEFLMIEGHRIIFNPISPTKFDHTKLKNIEVKKDKDWFNIEFFNVNGKNSLACVTLSNVKEKNGITYCDAIG
jgi:hypothetical protein